MSEISEWLGSLNLEQYAEAFEANEIDLDLAHDLDEAALEQLGVRVLGHRLRIMRAVRALAAPEPAPAAEPAADATRQPERRQITVMFCDMVGSTALSGKIDPEDLHALMQQYQRTCGGVIERFGGHVAQYLGDGLMVYFGWPRAHGDDAQRAVRAALEILRAIKAVSAPVEIQVRVGIATGPVVVGDTGDGHASVPRAAVGETPNLAARIQGLAQVDEIVISDTTRRLAGEAFEYVDTGEHDLKGVASRRRAWRVIGEGRASARAGGHTGAPATPLIGRDNEIDLLLDRCMQAAEGEGQIVLLAGEPGIGKSRLTDTLRERISSDSWAVRRFQCSAYYSNSTFHPWITHWGRCAGFSSADGDEVKLDKLEAAMVPGTGDSESAGALLAALLSLPTDRHPPLQLSPQRQKDETIAALVDQVVAASRDRPLLAVFEDVHWIDPSSLEALQALSERIPEHPILLVVTHRLEFEVPLKGGSHVSAYRLNRLSRRQCASMISEVTGGKSLPEPVLDTIVAKTDGVPLYVEEMTKATLEAGFLIEEADGYALEGELPELAIPATLQDSLMARLDRLPEAKEVARIGSAIGREFSHPLLSEIADLPEAELRERLAQLDAAQLVFTRGEPPDAIYFFKHALVQEVAYESLLRADRRKLHRRILEALEQRFPAVVQTQPELLARHARLADDPGRASVYFLAAGRRALDASATHEAIAHLSDGLDQLRRLEPSQERDQRELQFHASLGTAYMLAKGWAAPEVEQAYALANELARSVESAREVVWPLWGVWVFHLVRGEVDNALQIAERILDLANESQDRVAQLVARMILVQLALYCGRFEEGSEHWELAEKLYSDEEDQALIPLYSTDLKLTVRLHRSHILWILGYADQAAVVCAEKDELARTLNHPYTVSWSLIWGAMACLFRGDDEELKRRTAEGIRIAEEHGFEYLSAMGAMAHGWAEARLGALEAGIARMRAGLEEFRGTGSGIVVPFFRTLLAELLIDAARLDEAEQLLAAAADQVERWGERWQESEIHRVRGRLCEAGPEPGHERAAACYRKAIEISSAQKAKGWELRASLALARLHERQGHKERAREALLPVLTSFTEGFDTADLREARELANAL